MKPVEHVKQCCRVWKPSIARKMTAYFIVFGLIVFYLTASGFRMVEKKHFLISARNLVTQRMVSDAGGREADYIWKSVGSPQPASEELGSLMAGFSTGFHSVIRTSIYCRLSGTEDWYRLSLDEDGILMSERAGNSFVEKVERYLSRPVVFSGLGTVRTGKTTSMLVDISRGKDANQYLYRVEMGAMGLGEAAAKEMVRIAVFSMVVLLLLRILGYAFARRLARPLEQISETAAKVADGDLSETIPVSSGDEIGVLSENFNQMIEGLRERDRMKMIEFELEKGRKIQQDFLPSRLPHLPEWEISALFFPAMQVSGDFYDVFTLPSGLTGLVIGDVCDKGVGSALYMALFRSLIRVYSTRDDSAASEGGVEDLQHLIVQTAVGATNDYIAKNHGQDGMFATLFFGVLDPGNGKLVYINAGHEPLIVQNAAGELKKLGKCGPAAGIEEGSRYKSKSVVLEVGDTLVGYTDGVTEARNPEDQMYTRKKLLQILGSPVTSAADALERIRKNLFNFIESAPRFDDVTMLAVQRGGGASG